MLRLTNLLFLLTFVFVCNSATVIGGDIYYKVNSNYTVDVFVKRYTYLFDTDSSQKSIVMFIGKTKFIQTANKSSLTYLSNNCKSYKDTNKNSIHNLKVDLFTTTFNLNDTQVKSLMKTECKAIFYFYDKARFNLISTLNLGKSFYIEAMLNLCNIQNNEIFPQFGNEPFFNLCCNRFLQYNFGFVNQPKIIDSFSFERIPVMDSTNKELKYVSPFTSSLFMTPFCPPAPGVINCKALPNAIPPRGLYFNDFIGDFAITPTNCDETSVMAIKINLFGRDSNSRRLYFGYIVREMTINVGQCEDNNSPKITNTQNYYNVCENQDLCFFIGTKDETFIPNQTKSDTTYLSVNTYDTKANLTINDTNAREKSGYLCWSLKSGDGKNCQYLFTVKTNDNACPYNNFTSKGIIIKVNKIPTLNKISYKQLLCNKLAFKFNQTDEKTIQWTIFDGNKKVIANSNKFNDTIQLIKPFTSQYFIKCIVNENSICSKEDTIKLENLTGDYIHYIDTFICQSNFQLNLNDYNFYNNNNAKWYDANDSFISNNLIDLKNRSFPNLVQANYKLSQPNCYIENKFNFIIHDTFRQQLKSIRICENTSSKNLFNYGFDNRKNGIWSIKPNSLVDSFGNINFTNPGISYQIKYLYDSAYCRNYDIKSIFVEPKIKSYFNADKSIGNPPFTVNFINQTIGFGFNYIWDFGDKYSFNNTSTQINPTHTYDSIGKYNVTLIAKNIACSDTFLLKDYIHVKKGNLNNSNDEIIEISVYPNPSNGEINIKCHQDFKLKVFDMTGKIVLNIENLNRFELPKGIYMIQLLSGNKNFICKITVF